VGESGKIFVRGGESYETKTYIDGMLVQSPYFSNMPDIPTRGRFSPLLFSGTIFSTGGYSAEYGQALSSVVALNTNDLEKKDKTSISLMTVGMNAAHVKCWKKASLAITGEYIHTALHNLIFKKDIEWLRDPVIGDGTMMFRHKIGQNGMLKSFGIFNYNSMRMNYENFEQAKMEDINLINNNIYINTTYDDLLNQKWMLQSGIAYNFDRDDINMDADNLVTRKSTKQVRAAFTNFTASNMILKMGFDFSNYQYNQKIRMEGFYNLTFTNNQFSAFLESEITISNKIAMRIGGRAEHNSFLKEFTIVPRLSAAYKTGKHSQISMAYGIFYQRPEDDYLKINPKLYSEKSFHYVFNYQYQHNLRTFRIEAYLKDYSNLIKFSKPYSTDLDDYSNNGIGEAKGIDIFWRDKRTFKNTDYWISYSFINSKRNYKDYPILATPHFVSAHNLSLVYKRFLPTINTYVGATYSYASGRPYHDPNTQNFMNGKTKSYNDISLGITYLTSVFKKEAILHLMVNNILGFENIYGYRYRNAPDEFGAFESKAIRSPVQRQAVFLISILL
jgi:outer membrane cobalamin receptor